MDIEVKNEKKKPQLKDHELKALIQKVKMEINKREIQSFKVICVSYGRLYSVFLTADTNQTIYFKLMYWALKIGR